MWARTGGSNANQESPTFPDAHNVTRREWCALQACTHTTRTSTGTTTRTSTRTRTCTSGLTVFTRRGQTFCHFLASCKSMPAEQFTGGCRCKQANVKGGGGRHTPPFVCSYAASLTGKGRRGARAAAAADHALLLDTKHDYEAHMYTHAPVHGNARRGVVMHTPLTRGKNRYP